MTYSLSNPHNPWFALLINQLSNLLRTRNTTHISTARPASYRASLNILLVVVMGAAVPHASAADVYRWVDENGVVNYSQLSPRDRESSVIRTRRGGAISADATSSQDAARQTSAPANQALGQTDPALNAEQAEALARLQAAEATRQKEIASARESNCNRAKSSLTNLTLGPRVQIREADGNVRYLTDSELQEKISNAQRAIAENCSG